MKKNKSTSLFAKTLLKFDIFAEKPELTVDGEGSYSTWNGFFVSIAIIALTMKYGYDKFNAMVNFDDNSYKTIRESDALDLSAIFHSDQIDANLAFYIVEA